MNMAICYLGQMWKEAYFEVLSSFHRTKVEEQEVKVHSKFPNYVYINSSTVQNIFIEKVYVTNPFRGLAKKRQIMCKQS
jgi:hypothetical protein